MTVHQDIDATRLALQDRLASGRLSEALTKRAAHLLARIEQPARLGVFGLPGSGKTALLNLLLGETVLPDSPELPTISLGYGETAQATCTLKDGTRERVDGADIAALLQYDPAFIEAQMPLASLSKLSMMEIVAGGQMHEQQRALTWASKRVDLALWCSKTNFQVAEQDIWEVMPEDVMDHAFLLLTNFDEPVPEAEQAERLRQARRNGEAFFQKIMPIAPRHALAARVPGGNVNKEQMRASGAMNLISAILREVEAGRQGVLDQAELFLHQTDFAPTAKPATQTAPSPDPSPAPSAEPVESTEAAAKPDPAPQEAPVVEAQPEPVAEPQSEPVAETLAPDAPKPETVTAEIIPLTAHAREVVAQAVEQLTAEGAVMLESLQAGALTDETVVETCVDTVSWLADYMSASDAGDDPTFGMCRDVALDAADLAQLIQLEKGEGVAADMLSLMIQLKQDIQTTLAA